MEFARRAPHNSICLGVRELSETIFEEFKDEYLTCPTTHEEWQAIADSYHKRHFSNRVTAMDGKHVAIKNQRARSGTVYFSYLKYTCVILLALVYAKCRFIWADGASDAQVYNQSEL